MPEVQLHGFDFENWIKQTFFVEFSISYSSKWDIPAEFNNLEIVPKAFRHLPVSIKTCKNGCPIGFGDALRQLRTDEDFLLVVGFWEQSGGDKNARRGRSRENYVAKLVESFSAADRRTNKTSRFDNQKPRNELHGSQEIGEENQEVFSADENHFESEN